MVLRQRYAFVTPMWQKTVETQSGSLQLAAGSVGEIDPEYPLTAKEAEYLRRLRHPAKRRQWLTARALLHRLLDLPPTTEILNRNGGKPYLSDRDQPISISHTHGFAAVATAPGAGLEVTVGVDIEASRPQRDFSVRRLFMNEAELAAYEACPTEVLFLAVWSAKEALYKAFYREDGEITFKHHLAIAPSSLMVLPSTLPNSLESFTLVAYTDLPGRPGRLEMGLLLDQGYVVTYLRV